MSNYNYNYTYNYRYHAIYAVKFELSNFSSLGDMTSQRYPSHEGNESSTSDVYPRKTGLTLEKEF